MQTMLGCVVLDGVKCNGIFHTDYDGNDTGVHVPSICISTR